VLLIQSLDSLLKEGMLKQLKKYPELKHLLPDIKSKSLDEITLIVALKKAERKCY